MPKVPGDPHPPISNIRSTRMAYSSLHQGICLSRGRTVSGDRNWCWPLILVSGYSYKPGLVPWTILEYSNSLWLVLGLSFSHIFGSNQPILMQFLFCFKTYYVVNLCFWGEKEKYPSKSQIRISVQIRKSPTPATSVKSAVKLFADDCLLHREFNSFVDHLALQNDRQLEQWASDRHALQCQKVVQ